MGEGREQLREALKRTAVALKESRLPFALAGGFAAWARGGPEPDHDVDFVVAERDAESARTALSEVGLDVVEPPEDWLFKVFVGDAMVDVIFRLAGRSVDRALVGRAEDLDVLSVHMPVMSAQDVMATKLRALSEHECDFGPLLTVARSLREQVDWRRLRDDVAANDYAAAFLFLVDRLGAVDTGAREEAG